MPNHKSALKRIRSNEKKRIRRRIFIGRVRKYVKDARKAIKEGLSDALTLIRRAEAVLASAVSKGLLKKNTASRLTSRLYKAYNKEIRASESVV